jgi:DNA repair exonuclease SbcCD ATPase subunit
MILRSIELEQFGKFRDRIFEFRRGMNLVAGPNEAGKSTLGEAIPAVLFGSINVDRFKPWRRGSSCSAALTFEGVGRTVEIRRNLVTDEVRLIERDDLYHTLNEFSGRVPLRGRSAVCQEYQALLEQLIGVAEEDLFRATYFFGQSLKEWTGDSLAQKLRTLVSGAAETDYASTLDALIEEHFALTSQNPWGRNKQRERELELVEKQLTALEGESSSIESSPVTVTDELAGQIRSLEEQLEKERDEYQKGVRYVDNFRQRLRCQENDPTLQPPPPVQVDDPTAQQQPAVVDGPAIEVDLSRKKLTDLGLPEVLPPNLKELLAEAEKIRQELAQSHQPMTKLKQSEKRVPRVPWAALSVFSTLFIVLGAAAWWFDFWAIPAIAASSFVALCSLGWGCWRHKTRNTTLTEIGSQLNRLEQQRAAILTRQAELTERCEALGLPSSPIDLVKIQKVVGRNRAFIDQHLSTSSRKVDPVECVEAPEKVEPPAPVEMVASQDGTSKADQQKELDEFEQKLAEFAGQLAGREKELATLRQQAEDAHEPAEAGGNARQVALREQKDRIEKRIAVLRLSIELLSGAVEAYGQSHLVKLVDEAGRLFGKMTAGRYKNLRLDQEMRPEVRIDERRWVSAERFSRGTIDALYLALRIALAKLRGDGRSLPLLLDDPFVHLDQKRLRAAMNMVDMVSAEGQLIIMSHQQDLAKRAARERWHVVSLGDELAGAEDGEGEEHAGQMHLL